MTDLPVADLPLPPGDLVQLFEAERADRQYLLRAGARHGPIFKAMSGEHLCVCVLGLERGRRLLLEHRDALTPVTLALESLFPLGFMRQMRGRAHRRYRGALVRAVARLAGERPTLPPHPESVRAHLDAHIESAPVGRGAARAYLATLNGLATEALVEIFFGAPAGSAFAARLHDAFRALGPSGLAWNIGPPQVRAYADIVTALTQRPGDLQPGLLELLAADGMLDETMLGNLIYMVEMGRDDLSGYLRWLTWHVVHAACAPEDFATATGASRGSGPDYAEAFALETLRMDQSERLLRKVEQDIAFDGYRIPATATVRICLWESHKLASAFAVPFRFDPNRFLTHAPGPEQYAPFGLDQHQCPLARFAVTIGATFVRTLVEHYRVECAQDGAAVRGPYHWQPSPRFAIRLARRQVGP